ncbi:terpene synthase family protein [Streptomyces inhibens]|uniref:terpene synthase family protein n=1 Tax=Streptomyces inhibens TaxID=2293571 RepID=UPI003CCA515E|nr:hypothetical protein KI385_43240 [Streptomyces inhibens]
MRHIAAEVDTIHNSLCSAEKEEARGEMHNLLLILERREHLSRAEAVEEMCRMIRSRTERSSCSKACCPVCATASASPRRSVYRCSVSRTRCGRSCGATTTGPSSRTIVPRIVDDELWALIEPLLPSWPKRSPGLVRAPPSPMRPRRMSACTPHCVSR